MDLNEETDIYKYSTPEIQIRDLLTETNIIRNIGEATSNFSGTIRVF